MEAKPNVGLEVPGYSYLGRGPAVTGSSVGWDRKAGLVFRCARCGTLMPSLQEDFFACACGAMRLEPEAGRFGSRYGDREILVYLKEGEGPVT